MCDTPRQKKGRERGWKGSELGVREGWRRQTKKRKLKNENQNTTEAEMMFCQLKTDLEFPCYRDKKTHPQQHPTSNVLNLQTRAFKLLHQQDLAIETNCKSKPKPSGRERKKQQVWEGGGSWFLCRLDKWVKKMVMTMDQREKSGWVDGWRD